MPRKAPPIPKPFRDLTQSEDIGVRRRVAKMMAEMSRNPGYSWNRPPETFRERLRREPLAVIGPFFGGIAMALGMLWILYRYGTQGFPPPPPPVIYVQNFNKGTEALPPLPKIGEAEKPAKAEAKKVERKTATPREEPRKAKPQKAELEKVPREPREGVKSLAE